MTRKANPTKEEILQCYDYIRRYYLFFGLDEDDCQMIAIKFFKYYDTNGGRSVDSFTNLLLKQRKADKYFRQGKMRTATTIDIDQFETNDTLSMLGEELEFEFIINEEEEVKAALVQSLLELLTVKQKYIMEELLNGKTLTLIAKELKITRGAASGHKEAAINRIKRKLNK